MISYISGKLQYKDNGFLVIDTAGGVGYKVFVSEKTFSMLPELGKDIRIFTYMHIKEDEISLYGFLKDEELNVFNKLISVSGIGPRIGLVFLSTLSPSEIIKSVLSSDTDSLCSVPGVGKKTAQRLVLELKDKFKNEDFLIKEGNSENKDFNTDLKYKSDAVEALISLGYNKSEAIGAVSAVFEQNISTEDLLKKALKKLIRI